MSAIIFIFVTGLFTVSIVCGVCYGVAIRDYGQRYELGHVDKSPCCASAIREAKQFLVVGAATYLIGAAVLFSLFWYS